MPCIVQYKSLKKVTSKAQNSCKTMYYFIENQGFFNRLNLFYPVSPDNGFAYFILKFKALT